MKTYWLRRVLAFGILVLVAAPAQQDETADPAVLFRRLRDELGSVETLKAEFVQERHVALFTDVLRTEGTLYFSRPRSLRFEVSQPFRSVLLVNGRKMRKFEFVDGRWAQSNPDNPGATQLVMMQMGAWLRGDILGEGDSAYTPATRPGEPLTVVLTPKDSKVLEYCREIELKFAEGPLRLESVTVHEQGEDFTRVAFSNEQRNVKFPRDFFEDLEPAAAKTE